VAAVDVLRTTCPRDCYDSCGIEVLVRDGDVRVRGDREHPVSRGKLCRKCTLAYNGAFLDPEARLTEPLRRTGPKGSGAFAPVSGEDALALIAARLQDVVDRVGAPAILNAHYTGTFSLLAYTFPLRFFRRLGATEVDPDTVCNNAGHVALDYVYGSSVDGFDPRTARDSACILVWGANPAVSAPHQHEHWLPESGATVIVVDPIRTATARDAGLHLQPFPGTDAALAFAMLHVARRDGLIDDDYLGRHTIGWDELEPHVERATPGWAAQATGVPEELLERAARAYAAGPSLLWIGQGLQRQPLGGNVVRAIAALPPATGNLGRPGTGVLYLNGAHNRRIDEDWLATGGLELSAPPPVSHMDLADVLADPARASALVTWNINIAASNPRQGDLREALRREDLFTVAIDLFATDTTDLADVVLPAASFLEFDDLVASYFHRSLSAQQRVMAPPGQALPNTEIFRRLAAAMGFDEPALHASDHELVATLLERAGHGVDFAALCEAGTIWPSAQPEIPFADGRFATPSGRIELASARAQGAGLPRTPLPHTDPRPPGGALRLLTPASEWTLNDSYANDPKVARQMGAPTIALHPGEAADRRLRPGDLVTVTGPAGALDLTLATDDAVPRGVAYAPKGRWPKREASGANVNVLNAGEKADMGESTAVHGTLVTLQRARDRTGARLPATVVSSAP
jgi:anaerobic selenocysteine-containing dehydrogenase